MHGLLAWVAAVKEQAFAWMDGLAASPHPGWWLFALAFAESSFFPIPPDVLLITLGVADPAKAIWYGLVCTVASVLGGALGYVIGKSVAGNSATTEQNLMVSSWSALLFTKIIF